MIPKKVWHLKNPTEDKGSPVHMLAYFLFFEGFTSIPTALTANDRNRRIQVYQASDG